MDTAKCRTQPKIEYNFIYAGFYFEKKRGKEDGIHRQRKKNHTTLSKGVRNYYLLLYEPGHLASLNEHYIFLTSQSL